MILSSNLHLSFSFLHLYFTDLCIKSAATTFVSPEDREYNNKVCMFVCLYDCMIGLNFTIFCKPLNPTFRSLIVLFNLHNCEVKLQIITIIMSCGFQ